MHDRQTAVHSIGNGAGDPTSPPPGLALTPVVVGGEREEDTVELTPKSAKMLFANEQRKAWSIQRNAGKITGGYWQLVDQEWTKLPLSEQAAYQAGLIIVVCSLRSERYASRVLMLL